VVIVGAELQNYHVAQPVYCQHCKVLVLLSMCCGMELHYDYQDLAVTTAKQSAKPTHVPVVQNYTKLF